MGNSQSEENKEADGAGVAESVVVDDYPQVFTPKLLSAHNGATAEVSLYIAVNSTVLDVSSERGIYGPGGEKESMAGVNTEMDEDEAAALINAFPHKGILITPHQFTTEELATYDGKQSKFVLLCAKGEVFDVTPGRSFYGPEGGYKMMAGKDASRALALMSLDVKDVINTSLADLGEEKMLILDDWVAKYHKKYTTVGWMGDSVPVALQQEEQIEETEQTDADGEVPSQL